MANHPVCMLEAHLPHGDEHLLEPLRLVAIGRRGHYRQHLVPEVGDVTIHHPQIPKSLTLSTHVKPQPPIVSCSLKFIDPIDRSCDSQ